MIYSAVFAPSCISHTVLTKRDWQTIRIGEITLPQALRCWELQPHWSVSNHAGQQHGEHGHGRQSNGAETADEEEEEENLAAAVTVHPSRHGHNRYKANGESK